MTARFIAHAEDHKLFPSRQSAYRRHHSTETVVVSVLNDIIRAADDGKVTCLVLLDLSAAFDTVDHDILLDVFRRRFLVVEPALKWFHSYLNDQTQVIPVDGKESAPIPVACSVPQGSVLGPVQFISYSEDVVIVFNANHHVQYHIFADDKQLFASAPVAEAHEAKKTVERCVAAIKDWYASRWLKLNDGKTEVIWLGTRPRLQHLAGVDLNLSVGVTSSGRQLSYVTWVCS